MLIEKMRPKLLITHTAEGQMERGTEIHITLKIENIGETVFDGEVTRMTFDLPRSAHYFTKLPQLPRLKPSESFAHSLDVTPLEEGLGWLEVQINSNDKLDVECYQSRVSGPVLGQWRVGIYVLKPEDRRVIALLEKVVELLSK